MAPRTPLRQPAQKRFASALAATAALALAFTGLTTTIAPAPAAQAAPGAPFDCSNPTFFAQAEEPVGTVQLYTGTYNSKGESVWTKLGTEKTGSSVYNAVAFNPKDGFLYGTIYGDTNPGHFVRIDSEGNLIRLGASSPALGDRYSTLWDSGEFDEDGNYYVASGNAGQSGNNGRTARTIYKISGLADVKGTGGTRPVKTEIPLTGDSSSIRYADLTFKDGYLWAPNYGASSTIYRINVNPALGTVGEVEAFAVPSSVMSASSYGSAFTMTNGNLAFIGTHNKMVQIAVANPTSADPTFSLVSTVTAPPNQRSNATNCANADPAHLLVEKTGPSTVVVGHTITWEVTITNKGPGRSSGFVLTDVLPDGLSDLEVESDDSACVKIENTTPKSAVCNGGLLEVEQTATVYVSATAPSTPGPLQNQAYAIGNEDPNPDPPATADTTVVLATPVNTPVDLTDPAAANGFTSPMTTPNGGTVTKSGSTFTYTPLGGYSGKDSYSYARTGGGTTTVHINVNPAAAPESDSTLVGGASSIPVVDLVGLGVGTDLRLDSVGSPSHGATVEIVGGDVVFTPPAATAGEMTFTYTLIGKDDLGVTETVTVTVLNVVTADDDTATTTAGDHVDIDVRDGDTSAATNRALGNPSVAAATANGGTMSVANGRVRYTPATGFSGTDTFSYEVCDNSSPAVCSDADVTVTVENVFTPGAAASGVTTPHNTDKVIPRGDIVEPSGQAIVPSTVIQKAAPGNGKVTVDGTSGAVTYSPNPGYTGPDSFEVTLCDANDECADVTVPVTVGANTVAADDEAASTNAGSSVTIDVLTGDTSASGQPFAAPTVTTAPLKGTATVQADGHILYEPAAGFSGVETFTYRVCDTSTPTPVCDTAQVKVTVNNVFTPTPGGAMMTPVTTPQNTDVTIELDDIVTPEGMPLDETKVDVVIDGDRGTVTVDDTTGAVTYEPEPGYTGDDEFTLKVCDTSVPAQCAEVTVKVTVGANTVAAVDDSDTTPFETAVTVDVRANDTSASGQGFAVPTITRQPVSGTVTEVAGQLRYLPEDGFTGVDTFEYRMCDTSTPTAVCDTAEVTITVTNVFTPGTAVVDGISTPHNTPRLVDLDDIVTASGAPIDPTEVTLDDGPDHGTVDIDPVTGEVSYTPTPGYSGDDEFTLEVCDTSAPAQCTDLVIEVTVSPNTVAATDDSDTTEVETPVTVDVRANDTTASGQPFADPTVTSWPANGSTTVNADGDIVYTPDAAFSGEDTFDYEVCDTSSTPVCQTATVTITVQNVFVPGTPVTDGVDTKHREPVTIPLDDVVTVPGSPLDPTTVTVVDEPDHGTVDVDPQTGEFVYTPDAGFSGDDAFEFEVCDTSVPVQCATLTVTVHVAKAPALAGTGAEGVLATVGASIGAALLGLLLMLGARRVRRSRAAA